MFCSVDSLATPLHLTCRRGHAGVIRVLLHQGADPDQRDSSGCTSLITAAKFCPAPHITMKKLVDADCGLNHQDDLGKTALHYCCKKARSSSCKQYHYKHLIRKYVNVIINYKLQVIQLNKYCMCVALSYIRCSIFILVGTLIQTHIPGKYIKL